jgi:hypothetical protein
MIKEIQIPLGVNYCNLIYRNYVRYNEYINYHDATKHCLMSMRFLGDLKDIQDKGLRQ